MRRTPVNVALDDALITRLRVIAAKNRERVSHLIERLIREGIDQEELQATCNEGAVKHV